MSKLSENIKPSYKPVVLTNRVYFDDGGCIPEIKNAVKDNDVALSTNKSSLAMSIAMRNNLLIAAGFLAFF